MKHNLYIGVVIAPYRVDLCNWLYEKFDCEIYHLHDRDDTAGFNSEAVASLCRFGRLLLPSFAVGSRRIGKGLRRLVRERRPEVVFVSEFSPVTLQVLWIRATSRRKFKVVALCDDSLDMIGGNDFSAVHRLLRRFVPRFVDNLILVNEPVAAWYRERFGKGVCLPILSDERRLRDEMRKALPLCGETAREYDLSGKSVILDGGRLIPLKNVGTLLKATRGMDAKVVIVGDGEMRPQWEELAVRLGVDAVFPGRKSGEELYVWYLLADVLVLPSLQEAFGAVVNEALIAGCPAVVSDRAGAASLIDGTNGAVFDPTSPEELSSCLRKVLSGAPGRRDGALRDSLMCVTFEEAVSTAIERL